MSNNREKALETTISEMEKRYGQGVIMRLGEVASADINVVPSGSAELDKALGVGGYARGRLVEIFGQESSGKTTLALHAIAEAQKCGGVAAFVDAEHALDAAYAKKLGVNIDALLVSQPDYGEQALEVVEHLVRSGAVDIVVVDSVAALVPKAEVLGEMGDQHIGLQARLMSQALRKITAITHKTGAIVIFINQIRQKIGVTFGNGEVTTGGNALKFYCSTRIDVRYIGAVKKGEEQLGNKVRIRVRKNKLAPPFKQCEVEIIWGRGICRASELMLRAEKEGVLVQSGAYYSIGEERMGKGRESVRERLLQDPSLYERLATLLQGPAGPAAAK